MHGRNHQLPLSTGRGIRSFSALLTRSFRRVGLDEGTCGGCGCTNGTDSFPSVPLVLSLFCINSGNNNIQIILITKSALIAYFLSHKTQIRKHYKQHLMLRRCAKQHSLSMLRTYCQPGVKIYIYIR